MAFSCWLTFCIFATTLAVSLAIPYYGDLPPGPYCESRSTGCCTGRVDECSAPLLDTRCYCDTFCNRTRSEDCCPDFWSFCLGVEPPPETLLLCEYKGRTYTPPNTFKDNCHKCSCEIIDGKAEVLCDLNHCLMEEEVITEVNANPALGWTARNYSEFWGRYLDDGITLRLGTLMPHKSVMNMKPVKNNYNPQGLPTSFSASEKWNDYITPISDQGWCGSSWAISSVDVASDRLAIVSRGREKMQLSAQHLLSCNRRHQQGCHGGYLDVVWQFFRKRGVVDDKCYPYEAKETRCKVKQRDTLQSLGCRVPHTVMRKDLYRVSPAYRLYNETDVMHEMIKSGPVQATMKVYRDFFAYEGGIYRRSSAAGTVSGYHSVRIVGWGEERSIYGRTTKYWVIANSWGTKWGENGYFRIVRGENECEIETFLLAAWPHPADTNEIRK